MNVQSDKKCTICLDCIEKNSTFLRCAHQFHCTCINHWFRYHKTCPICRTPKEEDIPSSADEAVEEVLDARGTLNTTGSDSDVETVVISEGEEYSDSEMDFGEDDRLTDDRSEPDSDEHSDSTSGGINSSDEDDVEMSSDEATLSIYVVEEPTPTENNVCEDNATD